LQRQLNFDLQTTALLVSGCDFASIQECDALCNGQAKTNSPRSQIARFGNTVERLKEAG
jgi:hypothetical protein